MLVNRLYLRNYRVYEDELDLDIPPGLVGIYGPNGAGKSALLESITWTLFGRARTPKEDLRSSGTHRDCVTEVSFEHEGHLYLVRRTLSGASSTVKAEAHCDGLGMAEGVRDTTRYVHSVLGMDDAAFRASVFAEQKQLAAFSSHPPAERRKLVLQLLGVTPLDDARDRARKDARDRTQEHIRLRSMLPEVGSLEVAAADADAAAGAAESQASEAESAATAARSKANSAQDAFSVLDRRRQEYDQLVVEGRAARGELDSAVAQVASFTEELSSLRSAADDLGKLEERCAHLPGDERVLPLVEDLDRAVQARRRLGNAPPSRSSLPDLTALEEADTKAAEAAEVASRQLAELEGRRRGAGEDVKRARDAQAASSSLSGTEDCPLCGQALGEAFEQVQAHRAAELTAAERRVEELSAGAKEAADRAKQLRRDAQAAHKALESARAEIMRWEQTAARHQEASEAVSAAWQALDHRLPEAAAGEGAGGTAATGGTATAAGEGAAGGPPAADAVTAALGRLRERVAAGRRDASAAARLRGRLERQPEVERQLKEARVRSEKAQGVVVALREKVKALGFDAAKLAEAKETLDAATSAADGASRQAQEARLNATRMRERSEAQTRRLADAREQHSRLGELEDEARHLTRLSELLAAFRNTVVASVGPRLAVQAADLFAELTDHEYDMLDVDPDTYQLKVVDQGQAYALDRFSGSEIDLANLALRVAISEHVRFQSGGSVGLLVLDEVFGPLDDDRTTRMLQALDHLRGRFRQILVVTHASDVKDQLPNAIEVVKRPGRRATARVLNS